MSRSDERERNSTDDQHLRYEREDRNRENEWVDNVLMVVPKMNEQYEEKIKQKIR